MEKTTLWKAVVIVYWTLLFAAAAFGYWLIVTTLF